jgi:TonB family protein
MSHVINRKLIAVLSVFSIIGCASQEPIVPPNEHVANQIASNACKGIKPIKFAPLSYPVEAKRKGQEGWVATVYDITKEGIPNNIRIVDSSPKQVFESAVILSLGKSRFLSSQNGHSECVFFINFRIQ